MKQLAIIIFLSLGLVSASQAGRKNATVDYSLFDVSAIPAPIPWSTDASATCPYDEYDLQQAATYAYHYYNDVYWTAKSGYEEWGWAWNTTRNWLQREMYDRWMAENPGMDDPMDEED